MKRILPKLKPTAVARYNQWVVLAVFLLVSCPTFGLSSHSGKENTIDDTVRFYRSIRAIRANSIINAHLNDPLFVVIDVRNPDDYAKEHIARAVNINFKSSDFKARLNDQGKAKTYLVICYAGVRSKSTMRIMQDLHFSRVYNIKGGMAKWRAKKLPLVKGSL